MTDNAFVDYPDFDASKLLGGSVEEKTIQGKTEKYKQIDLKYNYGTVEKPMITDCYFQFPPCKTSGLLIKTDKEQPNKPPSYSMMIKFAVNDEEHKKCLAQIAALHKSCCNILHRNRVACGMFDFEADRPGQTFKSPVYFARDKLTGEIMQGRDPSMFAKLISYKGGRTLFSYPDNEDIDPKTGRPNLKSINWEALEQVDMSIIPLIKFEKIYIGSKASLQCKMVSAIVLSVVKSGSQSRQLSTVERLLSNQPNLADTISSQVASLRMEVQDKIVDNSTGQGQGQGQIQGQGQGQGQIQGQGQGQGQIQGQNQYNQQQLYGQYNQQPPYGQSNQQPLYGQQIFGQSSVTSSMDDYLGKAPSTNMVQQSSPSFQGNNVIPTFGQQTVQMPSISQGQNTAGTTTIKLN